jgi:hypothetical protein
VALSTTGRTLEVGSGRQRGRSSISPGIDPPLLKSSLSNPVGEYLEGGVSRPSVHRRRLNRVTLLLLTPLTAPARRRSNQSVRASVVGRRGHQLSEDPGHCTARPRNRP